MYFLCKMPPPFYLRTINLKKTAFTCKILPTVYMYTMEIECKKDVLSL